MDELNNYFAQISGLTNGERCTEATFLGELDYSDEKFYWSNVTPLAIRKAISRTRSNATGVDELSPRLIKMVLPVIMPILEHLFNQSLMQGIFPSIWKIATVSPVPKCKNPAQLKDYRPISILPILSKMLERIACEQMQTFLEENSLLDPCQFAYRRGHSTQSCLIRVLDDIRQAVDNRLITIAVFIDLSNAFDRVVHHTLIAKLRSLNFSSSSLQWICSYLDNRMQAVKKPYGWRFI